MEYCVIPTASSRAPRTYLLLDPQELTEKQSGMQQQGKWEQAKVLQQEKDSLLKLEETGVLQQERQQL
ncbi:hypothetical protein DPEC_G00259050 [Dallia pectoralis]|uniref:Uncharacterized protein n=1 Tax=Dallia pectoralis TaxID=75939 RepID=A0ACC2FRF4_DALPE|nr:hypothetical protein DPEC_G00259050 [Dallia pectoralis]